MTWDGTDYTGLDLSSAGPPALKAAELTTLLDGTGVTVSYIAGRYVAQFAWQPAAAPEFGAATVEVAFGLDPDSADYPEGPFVRTRDRALTVTAALTRRTGFPADGLTRVRQAAVEVVIGTVAMLQQFGVVEADRPMVAGYGVGEELWSNDILAAMERVPGTRITTLSVQAASVDVSGVAVPLDQLWTLASGDLTVTVA